MRNPENRIGNVLHLYAQPYWHAEAFISGEREALMKLRDTITVALHDGLAACDLSAADGEGYSVHVVCMRPDDAERQSVPYTDECAKDQSGGNFGPWDTVLAGPTRA